MSHSTTFLSRVRPRLRRVASWRSRGVEARLREIEAEIQENRRLQRRVAELTDVVTELLVPLADGDAAQARVVLERYRTLV